MGSPNFGMGPNYGSAFGGLPQPWQTWQQPQYQYQQFSPFQQTSYWQAPQNTGTTGTLSNMGGGKGGGYGASGQAASGNTGTLGNGLFSSPQSTAPGTGPTVQQQAFPQVSPSAPQASGQWWNINPLSSSLQQYWNQQLGNWGGSGNVNDLLTKWNSFTDPNQAFTWAQANAGNEGLYGKNLLMNLSNIARMASPVDPNAGTSSLGNNWDYWTNLAESWNPGQRLGS